MTLKWNELIKQTGGEKMNKKTPTWKEILKKQQELDAMIAEYESHEFPREGDEYYITDYGTASRDEYDEQCNSGRLAIGNVFSTKKRAEFELERRKVIYELKKFASTDYYENYVIGYDNNDNVICSYIPDYYDYNRKLDTLYFESKEKASQAIEAVGEERVLTYYLQIKR